MYIYIDGIESVAFSPDSQYLATASRDEKVNLIDIKSKTIYHKFANIHTGNIYIYIYYEVNNPALISLNLYLLNLI